MDKLRTRTKIIFGSADLFGGGAFNLIGFYYLIFLTDVLQISPALAGLVVSVSKLWDAVSDPLMGVLTDRTRTRIGRRRPYFFAAVFTVFIAVFVLWYPADFAAESSRFAYAIMSYLVFSTVSTSVMIPYLSMQPELTPDYQERTSLNVFKMSFSFLGGIIAALVPMRIIGAFQDIREGWTAMALIFAVFYALPWLGLALHLKEHDNRSDPKPPKFSVSDFIAPLKIRTFRILIGIYLGAFLTMDIMSAVIAYFMTYVYGRPDQLSTLLGSLIISQLIFLPVIGRLTKRWDKNRILIVCAAVWIVSVSIIAFMPASAPMGVLIALAIVTGFGVCGSMVLPWTMYPDTTDVGRLTTGRDGAGSFSGLMTFFRKAAQALALFLVGFFLQMAGYVKPIRTVVDGVTKNTNQPQGDTVLLTIRILLCLMPALMLILVMLLSRRYPLGREAHGRLKAFLEKRAEGTVDEADAAEEQALREMLV